jgi:outer membrane protein assembly complex protein YaeT
VSILLALLALAGRAHAQGGAPLAADAGVPTVPLDATPGAEAPEAPPAEAAPAPEEAPAPAPADAPPVPRLCAVEDDALAAGHVIGPAANGQAIGGFLLRGDKLESDSWDMLQDVLAQLLPRGAPYGADRELCLVALLAKLEYVVDGPIRAVSKGGQPQLDIRIHPATIVRVVEIETDFDSWHNWRNYVFPPVLDDDMAVRLRFREGTTVPEAEAARRAYFEEEAQRLEDWLAKQGYFEARVRIESELGDNEFELHVKVHVDAGPEYKLGRIKLSGNTSVPDDVLVPLIEQRWLWGRLKSRFSKDALSSSLVKVRRYYQSQHFPSVRVTSDFDVRTSPDRRTKRVNLTVIISERKKVDVAYEGNDWASSEDLDGQLTLDAAGSSDDEEVETSADSLRGWYQSEGFFQALVTWERARLLPTFERLVFSIVEGPRWKVASVDFAGNKSISSDRLTQLVSTRPWRQLGSGGYVTTVQLEQDRQAIADDYRRQGFASVRVTVALAPRVELLDDAGAGAAVATSHQLGNWLRIRFTVEEGPRDTVGVIEFLGNQRLNDRDLERATHLRPGGPFSTAQMEADTRDVADVYKARGFAYVNVSTRFVLADPAVPGVYRVTHVVTEGQEVAVGQVVVRGNFKTRTWVIRDVLGLEKGQPLTRARVLAGREALQQSGLFSSVRLDILGLADEEHYPIVHPMVSVQERYDNQGEVELRAGYSEEAEGYVGAGGAIRNFGGVGITTSITALFGYNHFVAAELTGRLPWWVMRRSLRVPLDLSTQVFYRNEIDPRFGELEKYGFSAVLARQLKRWLSVSFGYNYVHKQIDDELVRGSGASENTSTAKIATTTSSLAASVVIDARRDKDYNFTPISPVRGFKLTLSAEYAASFLGGSEDFLKLSTSGVWLSPLSTNEKLHPLLSRFLVTNGVRYDQGVPLGGAVLLPETERFVAGGDLTIRGLEQDRAYTEVIRNPVAPGGGVETYIVRPAGGNIRAIYNLDLQIKICDCIFGQPLASAVFYDSGLVTNSFDGFRVGLLRHSIGVALMRVVTPVVSASIEYAVPLDPAIGDDPTGRFHINFGFVVN